MEMINRMKQELEKMGYSFNMLGDFEIEIPFPKCNVKIYHTLSDKYFVKVFDTEENTIAKNGYKTIRGAINFMRKNIIL